MPRTAQGPPPQEWKRHEEEIKVLYGKKPLEEVMKFMQEKRGLVAS